MLGLAAVLTVLAPKALISAGPGLFNPAIWSFYVATARAAFEGTNLTYRLIMIAVS